jgi:hypothetical protein
MKNISQINKHNTRKGRGFIVRLNWMSGVINSRQSGYILYIFQDIYYLFNRERARGEERTMARGVEEEKKLMKNRKTIFDLKQLQSHN